MSRLSVRLRLPLLIVAVAILLGEFALSQRSRYKPPVVQPRMMDIPRSAGMPGGYRGLPPGLPLQREQETTLRPPSAPPPAALPTQVRPVEPQSQDQLLALVEEAIDKTQRRYLDVAEFTPWQIMHGVLALRKEYLLKSGDKLVNGIEFISSGPVFRGESWWVKTPFGGRGHPYTVPYAFEGHINQFPALLSMSALPLDHQLLTNNGPITIADMVNNAKMTANTQEEVSWTLWFLTQYVDQDARWVNQHNQPWSMAELIRVQIAEPVDNAPCGGTHQLFALAFARNAYLRKHGRLQGVWMNAEYKLRQHIELARQLQNPDGTFSTNWFRGRGYSADFKERIKTSGHMLEWLMMALPTSRLNEPWVRRGVQAVATDLIRNASAPAECGPMYHAVHALVLYRERVAPERSTPAGEELAQGRPAPSQSPSSSGGSPAAPSTAPSPAPTVSRPPAVPPPAPVAGAPPSPTGSLPPRPEAIPSEPAPAVARTTPPGTGASIPPGARPQPSGSSGGVSALTAPSLVTPGLGYLSPAAPAAIASSPAAAPQPTAPTSAAPSTAAAPTTSGPTTSPATPPALLGTRDARPLISITPRTTEGSTAAPPENNSPAGAPTVGEHPRTASSSPGGRPLLILNDPVPQTAPSTAPRTSTPGTIAPAPPPPTLVSDSESRPVDPPAPAPTASTLVPPDLPSEAGGPSVASPAAPSEGGVPTGSQGTEVGGPTGPAADKPATVSQEAPPRMTPADGHPAERATAGPPSLDDQPVQPQLAQEPEQSPPVAEIGSESPASSPSGKSPQVRESLPRKPTLSSPPPAPVRVAREPEASAEANMK